MKARAAHAAAVLVTIALAGCGGASSSVPPAAVSKATWSASTSAQFRITIPPKSAQAAVLSPKYVSASTQSVTITLTNVNGTAYTGTSSSPAAVSTSLSSSSPNCTSGASGLTCTAPATAVPGVDVYSVATYDGSGNVLSDGTATLTVVAGQANTSNLTLNGVVASITVAFTSDPHVSGTQSGGFSIIGNYPREFTVVPLDADGNTIIGPGAPTFTLSSGSSAIAVASTGTSGTYTAQAQSYSTTPVQITITPSTGTAVNVDVTTVQEMWVANSGNNTITAYNATTGTQIGDDTITAGVDAPFMITTGPNGDLWISNYSSNQIEEVEPSTNVGVLSFSGSATQIDGPFGIAFDKNGNLYLSNGPGNQISVFGASSFSELTGAQDLALTSSTTAGASDPVQNAFDSSGNLWVAQSGNATVTVYNTSLTEIASLAGSDTRFVGPTGVAFDPAGHLWVADNAGATIYEFNATSVTSIGTDIDPMTQITGTNTQIHSPIGIAFDAAGNLWVANNQTTTAMLEFSAASLSAGGNLTPATTITAGLSAAAGLTFTP